MPNYVPVILFFTLFFGVAAFIFIATGRQRKLWRARPSVLRALAARRGYQFVENPGKPAGLTPIRPVEKGGEVTQLELPAAVRDRTLDSQLTLFDIYTETRHRAASRTSHEQKYETFLTIKSGERRWPHFEFVALTHSSPDSLEGKLIAMAAN